MKEVRVAIFIDYYNTMNEFNREIDTQVEYFKDHKKHAMYPYLLSNRELKKPINYFKRNVWRSFNQILMKYLSEKIGVATYDHIGTFITLGIRKEYKKKASDDRKTYEKLMEISQLDGFIVHFELSRHNEEGKIKEYGVDANIACQMLLGAFRDQYDVGVIVSNDQDFIPAIDMVQKSYGKKIYHLGPSFQIKSACYGSLNYENFFQRVIMINNE